MIVKGVKISELDHRDKLTGKEMIPFQDQLTNGKIDMKSIIDYFGDVSDQEISLQSLVNIKKYIYSEAELASVSHEVGDTYYNPNSKKLYIYKDDDKYEVSDPNKNRLYVRLDKDEYGRVNILNRWDGAKMVVTSESLFIGEEEGTAYDGAKGKRVRDDLDTLNAAIDKYPNKLVSGIMDPNYSDDSVDLRYSFYDRSTETNSTGAKTINCATQDKAGFMSATDKVKLDTTIPNNIKAEKDARESADITLQNNINAEASTRAEADSAIQSNLNTEAQTREDEDTSIRTDFAAADSALQTKLNTEISNRTKGDETLQSNIDTEVSNRTEADTAIRSEIASTSSTITGKLNQEISDRQSADTILQNNIDTEESERQAADIALGGRIDQEISDRTTAVSTLQGSLDTEIARAKKAEQDITTAYTTADTALQNNINSINNSKGVANGIATLDEKGLIPPHQLPSYVDDVIDVYATYDVTPTGSLTNISLYLDAEHNTPVVGESGKIYINITPDTPSYQFRWSGTQFVDSNTSTLILGEIAGTAYEGSKGKATTDKLNKIPNVLLTEVSTVNYLNDKIQLGHNSYNQATEQTEITNLEVIGATTARAGIMTASDKIKLDGLKDQASITSDINTVQTNLETHINNKTNPHEVTKAQVGLGDVDNTSDLDKPVSTATQTALDLKVDKVEGKQLSQENFTTVLKTKLEGLSNYDDTEIFSSLDSKVDKVSGKQLSTNDYNTTDKTKVDKLITTGDGTKYLTDSGQYKVVEAVNSVPEAPTDSNTYGRKNNTWVEVPEKDNVLTKDNTETYIPTSNYQPATKKYVDDTNFGKIINGSIEILNNCNLTGTEAETKIITLFGSVSNFKQCVAKMTNNHTRYFYHIDKYCSELIGTAYVNGTKYTLNSIITGYGSNSHLNKRISIVYDTNNKQVIIQDISTDDKLKTMFAEGKDDTFQDLNSINGYGIISGGDDSSAIPEKNYPIKQAGTLFYGKGPYSTANQIYGAYFSNRWFARGGGDTAPTSWREFVFKDDIDAKYIRSGSIDNITAAGEYVIFPDVTNDPFTDYCWLKVMGDSDIVQILIRYQTLEIAIRSRINGNWANWKYVTTSDNLSTITKVTTAQYNASSKASDTAYFVTN